MHPLLLHGANVGICATARHGANCAKRADRQSLAEVFPRAQVMPKAEDEFGLVRPSLDDATAQRLESLRTVAGDGLAENSLLIAKGRTGQERVGFKPELLCVLEPACVRLQLRRGLLATGGRRQRCLKSVRCQARLRATVDRG